MMSYESNSDTQRPTTMRSCSGLNEDDDHKLSTETFQNFTAVLWDAMQDIQNERSTHATRDWVWDENHVEKNVNEKKKKKRQHHSVHFSNPIAQVQSVSMSEDSREARSLYWMRVAADTEIVPKEDTYVRAPNV